MLRSLPYWASGAIIRGARTFVLTAIGFLAAVPFMGLSLEEYLQALSIALIPAVLAGLDKALREFRIQQANDTLANEEVSDAALEAE